MTKPDPAASRIGYMLRCKIEDDIMDCILSPGPFPDAELTALKAKMGKSWDPSKRQWVRNP